MRRKRTKTTTTTTLPAPAPAPVETQNRGNNLGINAGPSASTTLLDACVDLGVKWVRVSHESGWTGTISQLAATVTAAHVRGLRILQCVQNSGHTYLDPVKNAALSAFAVACADTGVDALQIGNEWNNRIFWTSPDVSIVPPLAQARLSVQVAAAVRAKYPTLPMVTVGMSPAADPLNPWTWWPGFAGAYPAEMVQANWSGIGLHGFCYPELATTNPIQWNPLRQAPTILNQAIAAGVQAPIWITEIGAPGFATNAPIIRGIALTEQRQAECYRAYIEVLKQHETLGMRFPLVAFATMFDGQSATNAVEQGLGLRRADGTKKAAWDLVRAFALEPAPA